MEGPNETPDVLVCQDSAALPAAAHTADVAHLHTHTHGETDAVCDTNHPSLTLGLALANLQADRQQGGPDRVTLCFSGGLLVGLFSPF